MKLLTTSLLLLLIVSQVLIAQDEFYNRIGWSKKKVSNFHKNDKHEVGNIDGMDLHIYQMDYKLYMYYRYEKNIVATVQMMWSKLSRQEFDTILALVNTMLEDGGFTYLGKEEKSSFTNLEYKNYNRKVTLMILKDIGNGVGISVFANKR